ncbi:DUF3011 domain-containing protein [Oleiagrimonas sp. C23AA]|nr:DUF3011 domain-containing protein [Oleiagrimonas sp. C23AA]
MFGFAVSVPVAHANHDRPDGGGERVGGTVRCGSVDRHYNSCRVRWPDARLVRQESDTRCVRGRNWGFRRGEIWVDRGCRGLFAPVATGRGSYGRPSHRRPGSRYDRPGWRRDIHLSCGSTDYRYAFCRVDVGRGDVRLVRQESDTRCVRGRNWGWNRAGVWTDNGCRARFVIHRR